MTKKEITKRIIEYITEIIALTIIIPIFYYIILKIKGVEIHISINNYLRALTWWQTWVTAITVITSEKVFNAIIIIKAIK